MLVENWQVHVFMYVQYLSLLQNLFMKIVMILSLWRLRVEIEHLEEYLYGNQ